MINLIDLLIVAAILGFAYRGWIAGLEAASIEALELLACLSIAVLAHEAVAAFLHTGVTLALGDGVSVSWSIVLAFSLLGWGVFACIRLLAHGKPADDEDQEGDVDPLGDRLAGAIAGGFGGALFVGGALVTISMVPFLAGMKPSGDRMLLDVGKTVLRAGGQFATESHEGRSLPLWGEPPSRTSDLKARLASEPWFDTDDNGEYSDADRFRDVDGNGTFSKDLYYKDVDGDGVRRIGLVDKYVVGRWDAELISDDRSRPDLKPAVAKEPTAPKPAAAKETATPKPEVTQPPKPKEKTPPKQAKPPQPTPPTPAGSAKQPAAKTKDGKPAPDKKDAEKEAAEKRPDDDF